MHTTLWPLFGLTLRTARLELRLPTESEIGELARVAARGVHPPEESGPFSRRGRSTDLRLALARYSSRTGRNSGAGAQRPAHPGAVEPPRARGRHCRGLRGVQVAVRFVAMPAWDRDDLLGVRRAASVILMSGAPPQTGPRGPVGQRRRQHRRPMWRPTAGSSGVWGRSRVSKGCGSSPDVEAQVAKCPAPGGPRFRSGTLPALQALRKRAVAPRPGAGSALVSVVRAGRSPTPPRRARRTGARVPAHRR